MATFDLRLKLYIAGAMMGIVLFIVAFLGEFVFGWWNDLGLFIAVASVLLTVALGLLAASRFQVRELGGEIRAVRSDTSDIKESSHRIEGLLREIRDRLPGAGP